MQHTHHQLLAKRIFSDFTHYRFVQGDTFMWSPATLSVHHSPITKAEDIWTLLHEISHGELHHSDYALDIELIAYEAAAWEHARDVLAPRYQLAIDDDFVQDHLDTYRQWLHKRSTCPQCGQNGLQTQNTYRCINCRCLWRTNEARMCALRRNKISA